MNCAYYHMMTAFFVWIQIFLSYVKKSKLLEIESELVTLNVFKSSHCNAIIVFKKLLFENVYNWEKRTILMYNLFFEKPGKHISQTYSLILLWTGKNVKHSISRLFFINWPHFVFQITSSKKRNQKIWNDMNIKLTLANLLPWNAQ